MKSLLVRTLLLLTLAQLTACQSVDHVPRTQIMVRIDADRSVLARMQYLWIGVSAQEGTEWKPRRVVAPIRKAELDWPVEFGVIPLGNDADRVFEVVVRALDSSRLETANILAEQRAVVGFTPGQTRLVRLTFYDDCLTLFEQSGVCEEDRDCHGRECLVCMDGACKAVGMTKTEPWTGPADVSISEVDGGHDDMSSEGGLPMDADAGSDAGSAMRATSVNIDMPDVVAAPGCVRVRVTREVQGRALAAALTLDTHGRGALFADPSCKTSLDEPELAADTLTKDFYLAPSLPVDTYVAHTTLSARIGEVSATRELEIRMRARKIIRGEDMLCSLLDDGALFCNGWTDLGRLGRSDVHGAQTLPRRAVDIPAIPTSSELVSRDFFGCYIVRDSATDAAGPLFCWGSGGSGQLGDGSFENRSTPVAVSFPNGALAHHVAVGIRHTCAIVGANNELYCWGGNDGLVFDAGQADTTHFAMPTKMRALADASVTDGIVDVTNGFGNTCVLTTANEVWCWGSGSIAFGSNAARVQGLNGTVKRLSANNSDVCAVVTTKAPQPHDQVTCFNQLGSYVVSGFPSGAVIDDIAGSFNATCATAGGALYCWGDNPKGWLGTSSKLTPLSSATKVLLPQGTLEGFAVAGFQVTMVSAIVDGLVYSWGSAIGDTGPGALGIPMQLEDFVNPVRNPRLDRADAVYPGTVHGCATGKLDSTQPSATVTACWGLGAVFGNNTNGFLDGNFSAVPQTVAALGADVTQIELGDGWVLARAAGTAKAWGSNIAQQLGNGDSASYSAAPPTDVLVPGTVLDVAAAATRGCALVETAADTRSVYCWGAFRTELDQSNNPVYVPGATPQKVLDGTAQLTDVDVGFEQGCAVSAGQVQCWDQSLVVAPHPVLTSNVESIAMSANSLCAHLTDDSVKCSFDGQAMSQRFMNAKAVRVGNHHACALASTGELSCSGSSNDHGQLGNGTTSVGGTALKLDGVSAFAVGDDATCAKDAQGWKCWGSNLSNGVAMGEIYLSTPTLIAPWQPN